MGISELEYLPQTTVNALLQYDNVRLATFRGYEYATDQWKKYLSDTKFFKVGEVDQIQCVFCRMKTSIRNEERIKKHVADCREGVVSAPQQQPPPPPSTSIGAVGGDPRPEDMNVPERGWDPPMSKDPKSTFLGKWPHSEYISIDSMVAEGFEFIGPGDRVQCRHCKTILRDWETTDIPSSEHERNAPRCPLVVQRYLTRMWEDDERRDRELKEVQQRRKMDMNKAFSQDMSKLENRIASLKFWPGPIRDIEKVARTGFFYTGEKDMLTCYACACKLINWEKNDDPIKEHKINFPHCANMADVKWSDVGFSNDEECVICLGAKADTILKPCLHYSLCYGCSTQVQKCPLCRKKIEKRVQTTNVLQ